jgi:hypothetical protein
MTASTQRNKGVHVMQTVRRYYSRFCWYLLGHVNFALAPRFVLNHVWKWGFDLLLVNDPT